MFMDTKQRIQYIEYTIGYNFQNKDLLKQAFTRKSYAEEHNGTLDNEVLEFYGDKALDFVVMKKMSEYYGKLNNDNKFASAKSEGELTEIKKKLVCKEMLASKVRSMVLQYHLVMGEGDKKEEAHLTDSVQEDLFEAIVGAVAIDSGWNVEQLTTVVELMLDPDFYFENGFENSINYVNLVQQWTQKTRNALPHYEFYPVTSYTGEARSLKRKDKIGCCLNIGFSTFFYGEGESNSEARMAAAKKAYEYLQEHHLLVSLKDEVGAPELDRAINQLQELYQKGCIDEPRYVFSETHDQNGNPIWNCECHVAGFDLFFQCTHSSKKEGKKLVAYDMLKFYLNWEKDDET